MPQYSSPPTAEALALVERVARGVARSRRLSRQDADDLVQTVHVRMAERQYDVLRQFEGRSSLRTYLTVVIARMLKDWQNHEYGKWRPSALAVRQGTVAVALDRALSRDGSSIEEAVQGVSLRTGTPEADVRRIAECLPRRTRRKMVPIDAVPERAVEFADPLAERHHRERSAAAKSALRAAIESLPADEARLFVSRFLGGRTVGVLARQANVEVKGLYRRFEQIRKTLRVRMLAGGISCAPGPD